MAKQLPKLPLLRSDLEIIAQPSPGKPDRHIIKDPQSGNIVELSDKEIFICRQLDGNTSLPVISARLQDRYKLQISTEKLEAFIRQLDEELLLSSSAPAINANPQGWDLMKPLPFYFDPLFSRLSELLRFAFSRWFRLIFYLFTIITIVIINKSWRDIINVIQQYFGLIIEGFPPAFSMQNIVFSILVLVIIPFLREVCKAVTCRHYAGRVNEIRYIW